MHACNSQLCAMAFLAIALLQMLSTIDGRLIDKDYNERNVPEFVARCRASCLEKFFYATEDDVMPIEQCEDESNCAMCWDYCQFLYLEKRATIKSMCTDHTCVSEFLQSDRY